MTELDIYLQNIELLESIDLSRYDYLDMHDFKFDDENLECDDEFKVIN